MNDQSLGTASIVWDLTHLYRKAGGKQWNRDVTWCRESVIELEKEYRGRIIILDAEGLHDFISRLEQCETRLARLETYAFLNFMTQTGDSAASALLQSVEELAAFVGKKSVFFRLEWNSLNERAAEVLLKNPHLQSYRYYLKRLRQFAPHQLSQSEEELLQERSPVGRSAWNILFEKCLGQIKFGDAGRTEEEVLNDLYNPSRDIRKLAAKDLTAGLQDNLHILSHIFNTLAAEKMIDDRLRSYPAWDSAINLSNDLQAGTVDTLVNTVVDRYDLVHRYYRQKKELIGLPALLDYDRYAPVPGLDEQTISWDHCRHIVLDAFADFSPKMAEIADMFFAENWIHAPVSEGKRGGAFAHPCIPEVHPYVMVNYTGNIRDVSTVAHELGHGIHQYLASPQGFYNSDTPLVMAETASVFAEMLVYKAQLRLLDSDEARRAFVCQKLESIFATVFRQVAMNRFEHAMHTGRRMQGELSSDQLSTFWLDTQKPMFGNSVTLTDDYAIWWAYIGHFLGTPGYVYSYAFGELLVLALYARYQEEGDGFVPKYMDLLSAGGSQSPYDLMRPFDIDLDDAAFWQGGLSVIEDMLAGIEG